METLTWTRQVPVRYEADVAVIGGGIAGVSAAIAAAHAGASVILVERFAVTGGDMTAGGVANFCGETAGQGRVFDEIVAGLEAFGAVAPYQPYEEKSGRVFDHEVLMVVLQELLLKHGVKLLLHTRFVDARETGGRITECVVCGQSGPEAVRAKQFIDCTGEGQFAHQLGFECYKGRPEDNLQLPMSLMFYTRDEVEGEPFRMRVPEGWFEEIRSEDDLPMTSLWKEGPKRRAVKVKIPMYDSTDTEAMTAAEIRARRRMMQVLDYYQQVMDEPWVLDKCSAIIGIREGRRIVGDYVLTVDDLRKGAAFDDGVARGTFYLDGHKPDDDKRTYILDRTPGVPGHKSELAVPPYQIPLRSLIARDGRNLMMAGRCFSSDQLALSSARVSTSASMMGQAAGITAALCTAGGCDPRDIDPQTVRRNVEQNGGRLDV